MGVLLILGDEERPSAAMIRAFQDFRFLVFLPRWPGRTLLTGHGRAPGVPGAQTSCCGPFAAAKILDGTFAQRPTETGDDDMPTPEEYAKAVWAAKMDDPRDAPDSAPISAALLINRMRKDTAHASAETDRISTGIATLLTKVGGDLVDEADVAQQVVSLMLPLLVPPLVAELGDEFGATPEQVEQRTEAAIRRVLGSVDDAPDQPVG
jgi:hypothetical protein